MPSSTRLSRSRGIHTPDNVRRRDIKRVTNQEQRVESRRLQIPFELTDVGARQTGPERKLFLGQFGPLAQTPQFAAHHGTEA